MRGAGAPLARCPQPLWGCLGLPAHDRAGHQAGGTCTDPGNTQSREQECAGGSVACLGVSGVPEGQQCAGESVVSLVGRAASTAVSARAQLITANGIAHDPAKLLSPCLPPIHFPSQPHTQVLGPFLAPLLCLLVPCLGFLGICRGEALSG